MQQGMAAICVKGTIFENQALPGDDQAVPVMQFTSLAAILYVQFAAMICAMLFGATCTASYRLAAFCCLQRLFQCVCVTALACVFLY